VVPKVRETREYEDDSHNSENSPAQPFGHGLLVWSWPTHEGRIKFACSKSKYNGHQSHDDLKNSSSQSVAFLLIGLFARSPADVNLSRFLDCARTHYR
jgi:hypothetical protein